ncbi:unnamed protein product [Notodromas monacha]|uniref:Tropomodulin n=1 Tax=Notodromas monacha TaxID=399045 RepID=A0A7R9BPZ0_9CRUS|nr:unnamed protein product [Notodromas monacha]CAG0918646.1 unnamed protein product [Notodromas monacha]
MEAAVAANRTLYGKDLSAYDDLDVDEILAQMSPEEIDILAKEVAKPDPDDRLLPPNQRCAYVCEKTPSGPLDRKQLIEHINKESREAPDVPEMVPYEAGTVRGKRYIAPPPPVTQHEEDIRISLENEYEEALSKASVDDIVDLAAILGFHSMMNQDQYHASLLNLGQPLGLGWDGITKASRCKPVRPEPPNTTDVEDSIRRLANDDSSLRDLNWNNIKGVSSEQFRRLFAALATNTRLEMLSLANTDLTDRTTRHGGLIEALQSNSSLRVLNLESNFLSPALLRDLIKALLVQKTLEEFRAANQNPSVLGNKIEMEITRLVEQNPNLLRLGLFFEYNDAQNRILTHLQKNCDKWMRQQRLIESVSVSETIVLPGKNAYKEEDEQREKNDDDAVAAGGVEQITAGVEEAKTEDPTE